MTVETEGLSPTAIDTYLGAVDWLIGVFNREEVTAAWAEPSCVEFYTVGGSPPTQCTASCGWNSSYETPSRRGCSRWAWGSSSGRTGGGLRAGRRPVIGGIALGRRGLCAGRGACGRRRLHGLPRCGGRSSRRDDRETGDPGRPRARWAGVLARLPPDEGPRGRRARRRLPCSIPAMQVPEAPASALTVCLDVCLELACSRAGSLGALRGFTREASELKSTRDGCCERGRLADPQARTLRRKFFRPNVRKSTLNAVMAG
jgi:hypothetical protein